MSTVRRVISHWFGLWIFPCCFFKINILEIANSDFRLRYSQENIVGVKFGSFLGNSTVWIFFGKFNC